MCSKNNKMVQETFLPFALQLIRQIIEMYRQLTAARKNPRKQYMVWADITNSAKKSFRDYHIR